MPKNMKSSGNFARLSGARKGAKMNNVGRDTVKGSSKSKTVAGQHSLFTERMEP